LSSVVFYRLSSHLCIHQLSTPHAPFLPRVCKLSCITHLRPFPPLRARTYAHCRTDHNAGSAPYRAVPCTILSSGGGRSICAPPARKRRCLSSWDYIRRGCGEPGGEHRDS
jgi:hypothetical protein